MNPAQIIERIRVQDGYPRPDWEAIEKLLSELPEDSQHDAWCSAGRIWLEQLVDHLGDSYRVFESENFLILSALDRKSTQALGQFCERALAGILKRLDGLAYDSYFGKHVVLIFRSHDEYYEYIAHFYPEDGEYPLSGGVFLYRDYGHMVIPFFDLSEAEAAIAHEFTHACLRHLPIPLWLNEGLAVTLEDELCGNHPLRMDPERLHEHELFWNAETIQEFWDGSSFGRTDQGNGLSYELARYCIRALAHDLEAFLRFANEASFEDGGESAARKIFGGSLGGLIEQFFGAGDWEPRPER